MPASPVIVIVPISIHAPNERSDIEIEELL